MNKKSIEVLLKLLNSKVTGYRVDWVLGHCVYAPWNHSEGVDHTPSFGIRIENSKRSIYHCFSCGMGGDLDDLILDLGTQYNKDPKPGYKIIEAASLVANELSDMELDLLSIPDFNEGGFVNPTETVFPEAWLKTFKIATHFPEAMAYLISRGIDYKMVMELDISYDPTQHRVCFPFRNYKGELMGLQGRDINKVTSLRYFQYPYHQKHNLHVWMGESTLDLDQPVVLTEGPHDFARIYKHYKNVACSFTSGLSVEKIKRIADATSIITLYDFGAGGNAARAKLKKVLPNVPMEHIVPTEEQDDAGNMTSAELRDALGPFVELLPEDYWLDK